MNCLTFPDSEVALCEAWHLLFLSQTACRSADPSCRRSATQSLGNIARHEGLASLWQGTNLGLVIAVPLVAIYLPLYDHFSAQLASSSLGYLTPLVAGQLFPLLTSCPHGWSTCHRVVMTHSSAACQSTSRGLHFHAHLLEGWQLTLLMPPIPLSNQA